MDRSIRSYMTPAPVTVGQDEPAAAARARMRATGIHHLPVVEGGNVVGVVSERDILMMERLRSDLLVRDAMAPDAYVVAPSALLEEVLREMTERGCGSAIVVEHGVPIGILTHHDVMRVLARLASEWHEGPPSCDRWGHVIATHAPGA